MKDWTKERNKIIGLGENSLHKSYYPELQEKISHLEGIQENLQTIIDSISDSIIIHDHNGNILSFNNHAIETFGFSETNNHNISFFDLNDSSLSENILSTYWNEAIEGKAQIFEWNARNLNSNQRIETQVSLSKTIWKHKPALISVVRDFTKRKTYERELIIAKENAENANLLKTEFLNNMSHEIRTPLNGIVGFVDLLGNQSISNEKRENYTRIIKNSSKQLLKIIDDILEISVLETKQVQVNEGNFNLNDLIMELFSIFSLPAQNQKIPIYIKKELPNNKSYITSDRLKINKILSNLIENALKYTEDGYIELGYYFKDNQLIIYVKDTGIGISEHNQELIFDRFSQEDKHISRKKGGLGLGLSISRENAQLLGGDITVQSIKGSGSTFYVNLPMRQDKTFSLEEDVNTEHDPKSFNIIIAEDEEVNFLYIEAILEASPYVNYKLFHTRNGKDTIELCEQRNDIDLILMDLKMPIISGFETTRIIKEKNPNIKIIVQSAYATIQDEKRALSIGGDDFISKPINQDELLNKIKKTLPNFE